MQLIGRLLREDAVCQKGGEVAKVRAERGGAWRTGRVVEGGGRVVVTNKDEVRGIDDEGRSPARAHA